MITRFMIFARRYKAFLALAFINILLIIFVPQTGWLALSLTGKNILDMLTVIPPIFIILGLLDVWVKRETMIRYMGEGSGARGAILGFLMGSVAAGPLYAAFPVAGLLLYKGASFTNVLIMIGAWSTTKIPLLLFEATSLGTQFTVLRLILNLFGILAIAMLTRKLMTPKDIEELYQRAESQQS